MRNAWIRYRIMAYVVGTLLIVLVCIGLPLKYLGGNEIVVLWTAIPHGWLYTATDHRVRPRPPSPLVLETADLDRPGRDHSVLVIRRRAIRNERRAQEARRSPGRGIGRCAKRFLAEQVLTSP